MSDLDSLSFSNIEELRDNLLKSGLEAERVDAIITKLSSKGTNAEKIKAGMVAATQLALASLTTLGAEQQDYKGIATELDTSEIEGTEVTLKAILDTSGITVALITSLFSSITLWVLILPLGYVSLK